MLKTSIRGWMARLTGDRRGVSAVEFALMAPMMIGLYLGCVEISDGVGADRKVSLTAGALANLTAQVTTISTADRDDILAAASSIVVPYNASLLAMKVSCLKIDANGVAKVAWGFAKNTTARAAGSTYSFTSSNNALDVHSSWLILSEVTYAYTPIVGYTITGTLTLSDQMFMSPRISPPTYNGIVCT
jgi:Flp pilus assembly protein TadG